MYNRITWGQPNVGTCQDPFRAKGLVPRLFLIYVLKVDMPKVILTELLVHGWNMNVWCELKSHSVSQWSLHPCPWEIGSTWAERVGHATLFIGNMRLSFMMSLPALSLGERVCVSRKGGTGRWVDSLANEGQISIATSGFGSRMALVGTGWAISLILCTQTYPFISILLV